MAYELIRFLVTSITVDVRPTVGHSDYASTHARSATTSRHISREQKFPRGPIQARNPTRGLSRRRTRRPTTHQNRPRIHTIRRQKSWSQPPNNPQHPQRHNLARPPHHRQTRNRPQHPPVGIRTPQNPLNRRQALPGAPIGKGNGSVRSRQ